MGYLVHRSYVDRMYFEYGDIVKNLTESFDALTTSIDALAAMHTFKGDGAESIRAYFGEVHKGIISMFEVLIGQLHSDYLASYLNGYDQQPIFENASAVLPEDEMERQRGYLAYAKDEFIPGIQGNVDAAINALPSGYSFQKPNTTATLGAFRSAHDEVEKVKNSVFDLENQAKALFESKTGDFGNLAHSIDRIMGKINTMSYALKEYPAGAFGAIANEFNAQECIEASVANQNENYDKMISAANAACDRQVYREEEKMKVLEEGIGQWELVGIVAGVVIVAAGVVATVCTAGVAAPAFAFAGTALASFDTGKRIGQAASRSRMSEQNEARYSNANELLGYTFDAGGNFVDLGTAAPSGVKGAVGKLSASTAVVVLGHQDLPDGAEVYVQNAGTVVEGVIDQCADGGLFANTGTALEKMVGKASLVGGGAALTQAVADDQYEKLSAERDACASNIQNVQAHKTFIGTRPAYLAAV